MFDRRAFVIGLAWLTAACGRGTALDGLVAGERGKVASVRSGEVIALDNGLEVRLAGIEAPNGAEPLSAEARAALEALVFEKDVTLFYGGAKRDRYERALAHVRLDDGRVWTNGVLLEQGLARVRTYSDNRALADEMLTIEAKARAARSGLWTLADYGVLLPSECRGKRGFQIVEGRVDAVRPDGDSVILDLDAGWVRATVPAFAADDFAAAGRAPDSLKGRLVRVRGTLSGAKLRLDHPEAMEVLSWA